MLPLRHVKQANGMLSDCCSSNITIQCNTLRKVLSTLVHIHMLADTHHWLELLWLTEDMATFVFSQPMMAVVAGRYSKRFSVVPFLFITGNGITLKPSLIDNRCLKKWKLMEKEMESGSKGTLMNYWNKHGTLLPLTCNGLLYDYAITCELFPDMVVNCWSCVWELVDGCNCPHPVECWPEL